MNKLCL